MKITSLSRALLIVIAKASLIACILSSIAFAQQQVADDYQDFIIIEDSVVIVDTDNNVLLTDGIKTIGNYKFSLDGSLNGVREQNAQIKTTMKVIKNPNTGRMGITNGQLFIHYAQGENGSDIALNYGLSVVTELPSIDRIVVQIIDLNMYGQIKEAMELDGRIVSTDLDIKYGGGYKPR